MASSAGNNSERQATQNEGSSAVNTMVSSTGNLDEHQATQKEGSQPSTPRTRSRLRATATTLPQRRPASRHALINIMSPEKQMDNNFQLMHHQQTYSSHRIMLLDERFSTSTSLELNGDANGDADDTSKSYDTYDIAPKQAPVSTHETTSDSREP
jgi:hypothetical protein